ncbi:helix-hairpin-helix domain-containing protein [Halocatena salina]|uniref:Helix-hairpin-helix domain-containing protein n=1 Tax=Halocatena salina TaxID=2934340 RepID=A0A8U0A055_9EURY|nr:helix-hairpin-helix domain-containing protein [Halocatena salina]UPM42445.1 helix-hairpin-helix domain-containing protein [Halocatena salina]
MNLLDKIKSILNMGNEESKPADTTATSDVSSYESNSSDPSGNGTVDKKSDAEPTGAPSETDSTRVPNVEKAETDTDISANHTDDGETEAATAVEAESKTKDTEPETDSTQPETDNNEPETEDTEPQTDDGGSPSETNGASTAEVVESEPVDVIKGVGTTYAERLGEAGIETVDELAAADPEAIAGETDISAKRIERWVGRAEHR